VSAPQLGFLPGDVIARAAAVGDEDVFDDRGRWARYYFDLASPTALPAAIEMAWADAAINHPDGRAAVYLVRAIGPRANPIAGTARARRVAHRLEVIALVWSGPEVPNDGELEAVRDRSEGFEGRLCSVTLVRNA
jgi:hypothetical protein